MGQHCKAPGQLRVSHGTIPDCVDFSLPGNATEGLSRRIVATVSPQVDVPVERRDAQINHLPIDGRSERRMRDRGQLIEIFRILEKTPAPVTHLGASRATALRRKTRPNR